MKNVEPLYPDTYYHIYRPFKRSEVDNESYFTDAILYIHRNPVHHGLTDRIEQWLFSSYPELISHRPTQLMRDEVINWFGSRKSFIDMHKANVKEYLDLKEFERHLKNFYGEKNK